MIQLSFKNNLKRGLIVGIVICFFASLYQLKLTEESGILSFDSESEIGKTITSGDAERLEQLSEELFQRGISISEYEGCEEPFERWAEDGSERVSLSMIRWKKEADKEAAIYSDSLDHDIRQIGHVDTMLQTERVVEHNADENEEIFLRNEKRVKKTNPFRSRMYRKMRLLSEKINRSYEFCDTRRINAFVDYFRSDGLTILLVMCTSFSALSAFSGKKNGFQLLASPVRLSSFLSKWLALGALTAFLESVFVIGMELIIWNRFLAGVDLFELPVQALEDCNEVIYPFSVGGYLIFVSVMMVFLSTVSSVLMQVWSFFSPNQTFSFLGSGALTAVLLGFVLPKLVVKLTTGEPFHNLFGYPVDDYYLLIAAGMVATAVSFLGICAGAGFRIRHAKESDNL